MKRKYHPLNLLQTLDLVPLAPSKGRKRGGGDPDPTPPDDPDVDGGREVTSVKISRREADKVAVPLFPRMTHHDSWMAHCAANVLSGDNSQGPYLNVNRKANKRTHDQSKMIKGRQIIAMMYESFRTRDRLDMIVSLDYLIKLQWQGDQKMNTFKQTWLEIIIGRMRPEDVPSETALRDMLYSKIKEQISSGFNLMVMGKDAMSAMAAKAKGGGKGACNPSDKKGNETDNECKFFFSEHGECKNGDRTRQHSQQKKNIIKKPIVRKPTEGHGTRSLRLCERNHTSKKTKSQWSDFVGQTIGEEIIKVDTDELIESENSVNELGVAMHKARLKAQLMIDMIEDDKPGDRRVYIGVPGSKIKFLMGAGCGHDLISQRKVEKQGYGFVWPPGKDPFMINPDGKRISLFVNGDIPYVRAGSRKAGPCDDEIAASIKAIFDNIGEEKTRKVHMMMKPKDLLMMKYQQMKHLVKKYRWQKREGLQNRLTEENDAEDETEIEVEGEGAPIREAKIGTLEAEAKTPAHLCEDETLPNRTWGLQKRAEVMGRFDYNRHAQSPDMGVGNDDERREILVAGDVAAKVIAAIPTENRFTEDVVDVLRRFIGRRKVKLAYSDAAPEFDSAMAQLRIPIDHSLPGHPENNSLSEGTSQDVINTVATSLLHAGLPAQYWPFALNCVTDNLNTEDVDGEGDSAGKG
ncbi:unnamed protein product, partial [Symbiodinium sp. CCMP2456]